MSSNYNDSFENENVSFGKPQALLKFSTEGNIEIDDEYLKQVFEHPEVAQRRIVAFSIIGTFRKGKSFFMNYCLRYLYANYPSIRHPNFNVLNSNNWMGDENEPLVGFSWRDGLYRDTTGIVIWDDVFLHTNENGEKIAIIVMDTHGLFDNETIPLNNSRIFALGTLLSSIQVFNISNVIQEDQLQYLQYAIEFAKISFPKNEEKEENEKNFQRLLFLIRDWTNDDDYPYGIDGGEKYLRYILESNPDEKDKLRSACEDINNSFEILSCCLLPPPGDRIRIQRKNEQAYDGNWGKMNPSFSEQLFKLIDEILKPDNLKVRKIEGHELVGSVYYEYIRKCFDQFSSDELPETPSTYQAAVDSHMRKLVDLCFGEYKQDFDVIAQNDRNKVADHYPKLMLNALDKFSESKKMGGEEVESMFRVKLEQKINDYYQSWSTRIEENKKKIAIANDSMQKKLEEQQQYQLKIKHEFKKEIEEKVEMERKKRSAFENERMKKYKEFPSLLIDRKIEEFIRLPLNNEMNITQGQLKALLENPSVSSCKIVTISIVGALKSENSYFINYCLRYLYAHYKSLSYPEFPVLDPNNWSSRKDDQLEDISLKPEMKLDSNGIVFWNDAFFLTKGYEKVAIILLDTHAIYDNNTPLLEVLRVLEFGTLISSVQIFQLEHINQAIDLAIICNQSKHIMKPFQNIGLLVNKLSANSRWMPSIEILKQLLSQRFPKDQADFIISSLQELFESFECYELYLPENKSDAYFDDVDELFKSNMFAIIQAIFKPENLKIKKFNNKELHGIEYLKCLEEYAHQYQASQLLVTPLTFNAVIEKYMENIVLLCFAFYKENFYSFVNANSDCDEKQLMRVYNDSKIATVEKYATLHKMGTAEQLNRYERILISQIYEDNKNYMIIVKPHLENSKKLREEMLRMQESYKNMLREKDRKIEENQMNHEHQMKLKAGEIHNLKSNLVSAKQTVRERETEIRNEQLNNKKVTTEKEKLSQELIYSNSNFKRQSEKYADEIDRKNRDIHDRKNEISKRGEKIVQMEKEIQKLMKENNQLKQEVDWSQNQIQGLNENITKMKNEHQQKIASIEQNKNSSKRFCTIL